MTAQLSEVQAKTLINSIPHSKFSVTKGISCRSSMNTSLGCVQSCSYCYIRYLGRWHNLDINEIFQHIEVRVNAPHSCARSSLVATRSGSGSAARPMPPGLRGEVPAHARLPGGA